MAASKSASIPAIAASKLALNSSGLRSIDEARFTFEAHMTAEQPLMRSGAGPYLISR